MEINERDQKLLSDIVLVATTGGMSVADAAETIYTLGYNQGKLEGIKESLATIQRARNG